MMKSLKVEGKSYMGVGKIKPLNLGNFSPLLTVVDKYHLSVSKAIVRLPFDVTISASL
jgi:hypothetical protein